MSQKRDRGTDGMRRQADPRPDRIEPIVVGVIGLGIMGSAMSASLVTAGFRTFGYDIAAARRKAFEKAGGHPAR